MMTLNKISDVLKRNKSFLLMTHKNPDADAICSMLALGMALQLVQKEVFMLTEAPLESPYDLLRGADRIRCEFEDKIDFDLVIVLDCGNLDRIAGPKDYLKKCSFLINIDHHLTNNFFGDLNLVDTNCSSTGELVYQVIKNSNLTINMDIAEHIYTAIQKDTGNFRYDNLTHKSLKIAAEMLELGVNPWIISQKIDTFGPSRLKLLEAVLGTLEFHHKGQICILTLSLEMIDKALAKENDSHNFVEYSRFITGVEIGLLIRQTAQKEYTFSLRSNNQIDVSQLALRFGGGGHAKAAGFEILGDLENIKKDFLQEAFWLLDEKDN